MEPSVVKEVYLCQSTYSNASGIDQHDDEPCKENVR
jgi:hypothetical protein